MRHKTIKIAIWTVGLMVLIWADYWAVSKLGFFKPHTLHTPIISNSTDNARATPVTVETPYRYALSSGSFSLPDHAMSVDWSVINRASTAQTFRVTVYRSLDNTWKTIVAPGVLTFTLEPNKETHNANSVGSNEPFLPGFQYEVVVETNSLKVLPTAAVWQDHGGTVIPGTQIEPTDFKHLSKKFL